MQRSFIFSLITACLLLCGAKTEAQIIDTLHFNKYWQIVAKNTGSYYRIAEIDTINLWFVGRFTDYYIDGGKVVEGQYSRSGFKNGQFRFYYEKGSLYSEGIFLDDRLFGTWKYYYASGQLREVVEFTEFDFVIKEYYDETGEALIRNGSGKWQKTIPDANGKPMVLTCRFSNGTRSGTWSLKNEDGKPLLKEVYIQDQFIEGISYDGGQSYYNESKFLHDIFYPASFYKIESFRVWDATRKDYPYITWLEEGAKSISSTETRIDQPDKHAHYPLGMHVFYSKISSALVYPATAQHEGISGKVYVEFIVGADGNLYDIKVLKGIGGGCDQEAVIAILSAGRWFPAQDKGIPVEQRIVIPISFRIEG